MLEGNLADFTLPDILRLLAATSKTGRLALVRDGASGRVDLVDGRLRDASAAADRVPIARRLLGAGLVGADDLIRVIEGRDTLPTDAEVAATLVASGSVEPKTAVEVVREQTVDAVFDLLRWRDGNFRFERSEATVPATSPLELDLSVDDVLDDAASRLEVWPSVEERTGGVDAVVTMVRPTGGRSQVSLPPDGWTLLSFVDGRRSLGELAHLTGQGEFRTRRTLVALLDEEVVSIGDADGPGHVDELLAGHQRLSTLEAALAGAPATRAPTPTPESLPQPAPATSQPRPAAATTPDRTRPGPVTVRNDEVAAAVSAPQLPEPPQVTAAAHASPAQASPAASAPRAGRLRTDPTVDSDLVRRLIDGVEGL